MFTPGDKLEYGHYTILRELGSGGMGVVYHSRDEFLQREIALKMLLPELMSDDETVEIFHQEARLAAQLEHPNIVTIHNIGRENREGNVHHYIAMEFLPGGSLKHALAKERPDMESVLDWMKQLCMGLNYAHKRGVVHQDIKPDNIFITQDKNLKLGDFGLAQIATGLAVERVASGKGTPAYMSPELCRGESQDHRSDIYSLGTVFFELLTGERPFKAGGMIEMATKHATAPIPSLRSFNAKVPIILDKVVQKMMSKSQEDRYQTLADVQIILEKMLLEMQVARLGVSLQNSTMVEEKASVEKKEVPVAEPVKEAVQEEKGDPSYDWRRFISQPDARASEETSHSDQEDTFSKLLKDLLPGLQKEDLSKIENTFATDITADIVIPEKIAQELAKKAASTTQETAAVATKGAAPSSKVSYKQDKNGNRELDLLWKFATNGPIGWASSPVINKEQNTIFVGSSDGVLYAIKADNGQKLWDFQCPGAIITSPVITAKAIFVTSANGTVSAVNPNDGSLIFKTDKLDTLVATPTLFQDKLFVPSFDGMLTAISAETGETIWTYKAGDAIVSSPRATENLIFFGSKDKRIHAVSTEKGLPQWTYATKGPIVASPLLSAGMLYVTSTDGTVSALGTDTGETIWKYNTEKAIISEGSLKFTSIAVCSEDKWMHCLDKYKGTLLWKTKLLGQSRSALVEQENKIYANIKEGWLQCFDTASGKLDWQMNMGRRLESSPLITNSRIYTGAITGEILAYSLS